MCVCVCVCIYIYIYIYIYILDDLWTYVVPIVTEVYNDIDVSICEWMNECSY